jgi:hypothetical protein
MTVRDELQARALFEQRYGVAAAPVVVFGSSSVYSMMCGYS